MPRRACSFSIGRLVLSAGSASIPIDILKFRSLPDIFFGSPVFTCRSDRWRCRNKKGRREAGLFEINDRTGAFAGSVFARHRTTPAEAIIQAGLDGLLVVAESGADHSRRPGGERGVAEIVILVFSLRGPVRREHVFKTR